MRQPADRARHVIDYAGLPPEHSLERSRTGQSYEIWFYGPYVLRINPEPRERYLVREYAIMRKLPPEACGPRLVVYGVDDEAEWIIMRRAAGQRLTLAWREMTHSQRRAAVRQLAAILKAVHSTPPPPEVDTVYETALLLKQAQEDIKQAIGLPHVDPIVLRAAADFIRQHSVAFSVPATMGFVHGDVNFDNLIWDGQRVTALVDYDRAQAAALDYELDTFLRFLAHPKLFVAQHEERFIDAEHFGPLPIHWLREDYPALFDNPYLSQRLDLYSLVYDVEMLLQSPPAAVERDPSHPYQRIKATLAGRGHRRLLD
jgi:aminoglycoside phosphotransferase (APT) family kinase protein